MASESINEGLVCGGPAPPTDAERANPPAVWPKTGDPWRGVILGTEVRAVIVHWDGRRSTVCSAPMCPFCATNVRQRVQYHVAAWDHATQRDVVLVMGTWAAATLLRAAQEKDQLRGLDVRFGRFGRGAGTRYHLEILRLVDPNGKLRQTFDLEAALCALFGVNTVPTYRTEV